MTNKNDLTQVPRELAEKLLSSSRINRNERKDWPETYELAEAVIREAMQIAFEDAEQAALAEQVNWMSEGQDACRACAVRIHSLNSTASSLTEQENKK